MNWFKNRKTLTKLMLAFCLTSLITAVVGYQGISAAGNLNVLSANLYEKQLMGLSYIKEANMERVEIGRELRAAILAPTASETEEQCRAVERYFKAIDDYLTKGEATFTTEEGHVRMAKVRNILPRYESSVKGVMALARADKKQEAAQELRKNADIVIAANHAFDDVAVIKEQVGKATYNNAEAVYARLRITLISVVCFAILLAMAVGYFIAQLIARPLRATADVLDRVAEGDLTVFLDIETKDEVGEMAQGLNLTIEAMRTALTEVRNSAESMANSSQELASSAEELSSGAQEQASSLEETTSTLEEITSTVKQNADNAKQASQVATGSRDTAEKGGQVVSEAVGAMGQINESSKNIAEIITTIDEIAFQTNLLALNAAVEAARAGEQGRGFAVVATEVRNLAQRSATSAKEIKRLIQDSVRKVEAGSSLVNKSGETLHQIVDSVKRVTDIVAEIAAASREQSSGIEQVNKAMLQMDQVTQTNSSQTEELSATAQSLAAHAEQLQAMVQRFKVDADGVHKIRAVAHPKDAAAKASGPSAKVAKMPSVKARAASSVALRDGTGSVTRIKPNGHDSSDASFVEF